MTVKNVVGRAFGSDTLAVKTESGDWQVTVTMVERRQIAEQEWEERKISAVCTDTTFEQAYYVAMNSTLEQFNDTIQKTNGDSLFEDEADAPETETVG